MNNSNPELATTATPILPSDLEQAAVALMRQRSLDNNSSLDRRVTAIEDAAKGRMRDDDEILAKSKILAAATIRAKRRREERA